MCCNPDDLQSGAINTGHFPSLPLFLLVLPHSDFPFTPIFKFLSKISTFCDTQIFQQSNDPSYKQYGSINFTEPFLLHLGLPLRTGQIFCWPLLTFYWNCIIIANSVLGMWTKKPQTKKTENKTQIHVWLMDSQTNFQVNKPRLFCIFRYKIIKTGKDDVA